MTGSELSDNRRISIATRRYRRLTRTDPGCASRIPPPKYDRGSRRRLVADYDTTACFRRPSDASHLSQV